MMKLFPLLACLLCLLPTGSLAQAETHFIEAENFTVQGNGWKVSSGAQSRRASGVQTLHGASGAVDSTATHDFTVTEGGAWKIHVRLMNHPQYRAPFDVEVLSGQNIVAQATFDLKAHPKTDRWEYYWDSLSAELQPGKYTLRLRKHQNKNASSYVRHVDCFYLTNDLKAQPNHLPYGPQTWMRITLREGHEGPVQIHVFADHYRSPWYAHYAISLDGVERGLNPKRKEARLVDGQSTGWVNISEMVYQDSGARLVMYPAHTYHQHARRFNAIIELASEADDSKIVRRFEVDQQPSTLNMIVPPNLLTEENIRLLSIDREHSMAIGALADANNWPTIGKKPNKFPFFVSAKIGAGTLASDVVDREIKTLNYFGFNAGVDHPDFAPGQKRHISLHGIGWFYDKTFSNPDIEKHRARAKMLYEQQIKAGLTADQIAYAMLMDEPTGQSAAVLANDQPSIDAFRAWLKGKGLTPADLLVSSWDEVKPVVETSRSNFPALHYYTQQFRTVALGQYLALLKDMIHENWKADFPVNVNFSDGAVYYGNFYGQGVDYFALLRETNQNAIWSEDWSNRGSTYHNATYNVELMRAAAREKGQHLGQHLIVYAGRKGYDIRLKAVSEVARGVKVFDSYAYGPVWAGHDRSAWQKNTSLWNDHASVIREIGAVEDLLMPAMPKPAQVAILYSSASDAWTLGVDNAPGFERMHTWLALTHAQIPVDIVHELQVENGLLEGYKVAYLNTPNITVGAAQKLADWVRNGGVLILTAGAGQFDEYNRPIDTLDKLLPFKRNNAQKIQPFLGAGRDLINLRPSGVVTVGQSKVNLVSTKQTFENVRPAGQVIVTGRFEDGSPASVTVGVGKGRIIAQGFMPALDYIRQALQARIDAGQKDDEQAQPDDNQGIPGEEAILTLKPNEKSYNPWQYPEAVRQTITSPVTQAKLNLPIRCSVPLVDAVYMICDEGVVVPLANYTLEPIKSMTLELAVDKPIKEVRSVHQGVLEYTRVGSSHIRVTLPLDCTDFVTIQY